MKPADMNVLLTGATGGIGADIASLLARGGARLLLTGRDDDKLRALLERLQDDGGVADAVAADLATIDGIERVADRATAFRGGVNVLINNAGINRFAAFDAEPSSALTEMVETNVLAPLRLTHRLLPVLRRADEAMIVNVGSILGSIGLPGQVAYASTKFALHGFSEALRRELARSAVRVVYVAPRTTDTAMNGARAREFNHRTGASTDSPAAVAERIVAGMITGRRERFIGWPERLFVKLNALLPGVVDRAVSRQAGLIDEIAADPPTLELTHGVKQ
jgi:short-subunit dehydrogenase